MLNKSQFFLVMSMALFLSSCNEKEPSIVTLNNSDDSKSEDNNSVDKSSIKRKKSVITPRPVRIKTKEEVINTLKKSLKQSINKLATDFKIIIDLEDTKIDKYLDNRNDIQDASTKNMILKQIYLMTKSGDIDLSSYESINFNFWRLKGNELLSVDDIGKNLILRTSIKKEHVGLVLRYHPHSLLFKNINEENVLLKTELENLSGIMVSLDYRYASEIETKWGLEQLIMFSRESRENRQIINNLRKINLGKDNSIEANEASIKVTRFEKEEMFKFLKRSKKIKSLSIVLDTKILELSEEYDIEIKLVPHLTDLSGAKIILELIEEELLKKDNRLEKIKKISFSTSNEFKPGKLEITFNVTPELAESIFSSRINEVNEHFKN